MNSSFNKFIFMAEARGLPENNIGENLIQFNGTECKSYEKSEKTEIKVLSINLKVSKHLNVRSSARKKIYGFLTDFEVSVVTFCSTWIFFFTPKVKDR